MKEKSLYQKKKKNEDIKEKKPSTMLIPQLYAIIGIDTLAVLCIFITNSISTYSEFWVPFLDIPIYASLTSKVFLLGLFLGDNNYYNLNNLDSKYYDVYGETNGFRYMIATNLPKPFLLKRFVNNWCIVVTFLAVLLYIAYLIYGIIMVASFQTKLITQGIQITSYVIKLALYFFHTFIELILIYINIRIHQKFIMFSKMK